MFLFFLCVMDKDSNVVYMSESESIKMNGTW